jgi:cytochrome P450
VSTVLLAFALLLPVAPILNLCRHRSFVRRLCLFPRALMILGIGLLAYITAAIGLALFAPGLAALALAILAPLAIFLYFWRARPAYGRSRQLPPGRLRLAPVGPWVDYLHYLKEAERFGPLFKMSHFVRPMICIVSLPLGNEFLSRHENDTVTPPMPFNNSVPGGFMRYMAPALHRAYRSRMKRLFSDRDTLDRRAGVAAHEFRAGLERLAKHGVEASPAAHIGEMTFAVLAGLFFGLTPGDGAFGRLRACYATIDYRRALITSRGRVERSLAEIEMLVLEHALNPESLFARFVNDSATDRPFRADDPTLLRNFIFLLLTSWIDVADLLTWIFKLLGDHPQWLESVRRELAAGDESGDRAAQQLAKTIVLETLRLEQSEYLMRRTVRDIEFQGYRIPRNWLVRIGVRECHLDPGHFDRPREFNPERFLSNPPGHMQYSPFGLHDKSCLGVVITLWAGQHFVTELARGNRWKVEQDGPRELGAFHWRPSRRFRVSAQRGNATEVPGPG